MQIKLTCSYFAPTFSVPVWMYSGPRRKVLFTVHPVHQQGAIIAKAPIHGSSRRTGRIVLTPSLAVGLYDNGHDRDLGTPFPEFRSAVELAYRFDDRSRVGVMFNHISNAGLGKVNPGTEQLMLSFSYPLANIAAMLGSH